MTFDDGTVHDYAEREVVRMENYPPSDTPKAGWEEQSRENPVVWRRLTGLHIGVLHVGTRVDAHPRAKVVVKVEDV